MNLYLHAFLKKRLHAFLKKRWRYCNRLRASHYLLLNHWTKFNQIWCVSCSHEKGVQRHIFFFAPPPEAKIFKTNFVCLLTNERYKTNQTGFSFGRLVHATGVGLGGYRGGFEWSKHFFSEIQPDLVCGLLTSMAHATAQFFCPHPLGPWGGAKRSNIIKSQSQSQFQRFLNQTLCVFSQMKYIKHIRRDFHSVTWVMPQGWDLGVPCGVGVQIFFSQIQPDLVCELLTWMAHATAQFFLSPPPGALGRGQKVKYH